MAAYQLLLIEDNPVDSALLQEALDGWSPPLTVRVVPNGVAALEVVQSERPTLIMLDLTLPGLHGLEILDALKGSEETVAIPVIVFTAQADDRNLYLAYAKRANAFVAKPLQFEELQELVNALCHFWFKVAKFSPLTQPHFS